MLRSLQHLLWVAEHGSFTLAARRAHLTQPALSASIQRLEAAMGARLLSRRPRGAVPTAAGAALLPYARAALTSVARGQRAVAEIEGLDHGEVRLGAGSTACTYILPPLLQRFRQAHPGVRVRLRESTTPEVYQHVANGRVDLGVGQDVGEDWLVDRLVLVGRADVVAAGERSLVAFSHGTAMRLLQEQLLPEVEVLTELHSIATVKAHVLAGFGLALLSERAVAGQLDRGELVLVPHPALPAARSLTLVHPGEALLSPAARALLVMLRGATSAGTSTQV